MSTVTARRRHATTGQVNKHVCICMHVCIDIHIVFGVCVSIELIIWILHANNTCLADKGFGRLCLRAHQNSECTVAGGLPGRAVPRFSPVAVSEGRRHQNGY